MIRNRKRNISTTWILWVTWTVFVGWVMIITSFHEPWFDEAQAWMIGKTASIQDLFFVIPHNEGHPPLWHLILAVFGKTGQPYLWSLRIITICISSVSAWLVLYKAPFPVGIRMMLPFTYFFCYQYGVISRPYSLMILGFILLAMTYAKRNEKPWRHVLCMIFICFTGAYGIILCGGITLVWLWEIWEEKAKHTSVLVFIKQLIKDVRLLPLLVLLGTALVLLSMIVPGKDTYTGSLYVANKLPFRLVFNLVVMPAEAMFSQCLTSYASIRNVDYSEKSFYLGIGLGILFILYLLILSRKYKKTRLLIIPYLIFAVFGSVVYMYIHHIGVVFIYLLFWFWCALTQEFPGAIPEEESKAEKKSKPGWMEKISPKDKKAIGKIGSVIPYLLLTVSVGWNVMASGNEVVYNYGYGQEVAQYLEENQLSSLKVLGEWKCTKDKTGKGMVYDANCLSALVPILPFLSQEELKGWIQYQDATYYNSNIRGDHKSNQILYKKWKRQGVPDILIGSCDLKEIYGNKVKQEDYVPVKEIETNYLWKNLKTTQYLYIYAKKEVVDKYELQMLTQLHGTNYTVRINSEN